MLGEMTSGVFFMSARPCVQRAQPSNSDSACDIQGRHVPYSTCSTNKGDSTIGLGSTCPPELHPADAEVQLPRARFKMLGGIFCWYSHTTTTNNVASCAMSVQGFLFSVSCQPSSMCYVAALHQQLTATTKPQLATGPAHDGDMHTHREEVNHGC